MMAGPQIKVCFWLLCSIAIHEVSGGANHFSLTTTIFPLSGFHFW